jgi:hypothetical protein
MSEALINRAPRVRCYECGSEAIFSVCHHCQEPMCEQHSPPAYRAPATRVRAPNGPAEEARPVSQEFADIGRGGPWAATYHCAEHAHVVRGGLWDVIGVGAGLAGLGVVVLPFDALLGLVPLLLGTGTVGVGFRLHWLRKAAARAVRPPIPVDVNTVDVVERLSGSVRLEHGTYTSTKVAVTGEIKVSMSANVGPRQLQSYRKKHQLPERDPVRVSAGFILLEGEVGLQFRPHQQAVLRDRTGGLSLGWEVADGQDSSRADPGHAQGEWILQVGYELHADRVPKEIPLWIVPSFVPGADRRTLQIDLHWNRPGAEGRQLDLQMFDRITLQVPSSWGNVEGPAPGRVNISRSGGRRVIEWKRLRPVSASGRMPARGGNSLTLTLPFERPITEEVEPPDGGAEDYYQLRAHGENRRMLALSGSLEATFGGTLSGVTGVGLYLPGGASGHQPDTKPQTKVEVTFDISLDTLRYQHERVIPDINNVEDREQGRTDPIPSNAVPNYRTVATLTNGISADHYYVKSVVEHRPRRDDTRPHVVNRVWDVTGSWYDGVFPITFDINLRGEEVGQGPVGIVLGKTDALVTVKGAYAKTTAEQDNAEDELLSRIEDAWIRLHDLVRRILADCASFTYGTRAITESDVGTASDEDPGEGEDPEEGEVID